VAVGVGLIKNAFTGYLDISQAAATNSAHTVLITQKAPTNLESRRFEDGGVRAPVIRLAFRLHLATEPIQGHVHGPARCIGRVSAIAQVSNFLVERCLEDEIDNLSFPGG